MSSFGSQMRKRFAELARAGKDVPKIVNDIARDATVAAIDAATKATPPNNGGVKGTKTRQGVLAEHWTTDSTIKPVNGRTVLANDMQYASYVNDGHHVDKHFVPGLTVAGGVLQKKASETDSGLTVGTKTTYVPGLYMKEQAIGKYRQVVRFEVDKRIREAFK